MDVERASAAQRRRGRRLRAALRHERQSIAMALAESLHHTSRGQKKARAGEEGHEEHDASRRQKPPPPKAFFQLFDEEDAVWGVRPACLAEPRGPQERVQLRTVEHIADVVPMVQILDAPVPLVGDQLVEAFQHLDLHVPKQVIEVPKISSSSRCSRRRRVPVVQTVEQLVEVPEFDAFVVQFQEQIVHARGSLQGFLPGQDYLLVWEQIVDIPVPQDRGGLGGLGGFHGFSPGQGSAAYCGAEFVDIPVPGCGGGGGPRGSLQGFRSGQNSTADVEQNVDFPARGGLHGFLPGQGSSSSSRLHDGADDGIQGVFRTFHREEKKCGGRSALGVGTGCGRYSMDAGGLWRPHGARACAGAGGGGGGLRQLGGRIRPLLDQVAGLPFEVVLTGHL